MERVFILYFYLSDIEIHCKKILISLIYYSPLPASEVLYFQPNNLYGISSPNLYTCAKIQQTKHRGELCQQISKWSSQSYFMSPQI